jgi:hypothetical protein
MKSDSSQGYNLHFNLSLLKTAYQTLTFPQFSVKSEAPQLAKSVKSIHLHGVLVDSSPSNDDDMAAHLSQKKELEQCRADVASGLG